MLIKNKEVFAKYIIDTAESVNKSKYFISDAVLVVATILYDLLDASEYMELVDILENKLIDEYDIDLMF